MEYLMTYGWAILIIAVVLAVLFQLGVFSGGNFLPHAQAGSCQVSRTVAGTSLEGQCNGMLPQYVAQFNGASSYISIANVIGLGQISNGGGNKVTITGWALTSITPTSQANILHVGGLSECTITDNNLEIMVQSGMAAYTILQCSNDGMGGSVILSTEQWVFYATTFDGSSNLGYIGAGGKLNTGTTTSGITNVILPSSPPLSIGQSGPFDTAWTGDIANIQVYNTTLSQPEIQALYLEGIGGAPIRPQNVVGWWPLNGNANDYSGNNNNGATTNVVYSSSWEGSYTAP